MEKELRLQQIQELNEIILTRITVLHEIIRDEEKKLRQNFQEEARLLCNAQWC